MTWWQAGERWQAVRTSEFELQQLDLLRREPGIAGATQALQKESRARAARVTPPFLWETWDLPLPVDVE